MARIALRLVRFASEALDPKEDLLIEWLMSLNLWTPEVKTRVVGAGRCLPLDVECQIKDDLHLPISKLERVLLLDLIGSDTGLSLKRLGFADGEWKNPTTCVGKLISLRLGRVQDERKLKAANFAFDPRIQFLVGYRPFLN